MDRKLKTALQAASLVAALGMSMSPAMAWADGSWDSIAVDDTVGHRGGNAGYGVGTADTATAADQQAMEACAKAGNTSCKVMLHYRYACGAYASSRTKYGTGVVPESPTVSPSVIEGQARQLALDNCGNPGCELTISDCVGVPDR